MNATQVATPVRAARRRRLAIGRIQWFLRAHLGRYRTADEVDVFVERAMQAFADRLQLPTVWSMASRDATAVNCIGLLLDHSGHGFDAPAIAAAWQDAGGASCRIERIRARKASPITKFVWWRTPSRTRSGISVPKAVADRED